MRTDPSQPWLLHIPEGRREAVLTFVEEVVATCPYCGAIVRRNTPRAIDADERIGCRACVHPVVGECKICASDITRAHKRRETTSSMVHEKCADRR